MFDEYIAVNEAIEDQAEWAKSLEPYDPVEQLLPLIDVQKQALEVQKEKLELYKRELDDARRDASFSKTTAIIAIVISIIALTAELFKEPILALISQV